MKRAMIAAFIIFLALNIEAQAQTQTFSILIGMATEVRSRWLGVKSDEGAVVRFRIGMKTLYPNRIPVLGDKVRVEYLISSGVNIGYVVTVLESPKKPPKKPIESRPQLPPGVPPEISVFVGKWEGSWDNRNDMSFTLSIPNINLEIAEVKYESKDWNFSEKAKVISGEKPKIECIIYDKSDYYPYVTFPVFFTFEIQREGTLKGTVEYRRKTMWDTNRDTSKAVMRRVD